MGQDSPLQSRIGDSNVRLQAIDPTEKELDLNLGARHAEYRGKVDVENQGACSASVGVSFLLGGS